MLGVDEIPAVLIDRLHGATSGRPFFVEEVLRALVERGVAAVETGATMGDVELGQLQIPDSLDEVIAERVLALPASSMAVLTAASVATRPVAGGLLQAVVGQSDDAFEESARLLIGRQLMRRHVIGGYRIAHDRTREWVYAGIPEADRRALHVLPELIHSKPRASPMTTRHTRLLITRGMVAICVHGPSMPMRRHAPKRGTARIWQWCATNAPSRLPTKPPSRHSR